MAGARAPAGACRHPLVRSSPSGVAGAGASRVDLTFKSMDDFTPDAVARQVKPLRELLELRTKLSDLRGTLQGNDKLDELLQATLRDDDKMAQLKAELGLDAKEG